MPVPLPFGRASFSQRGVVLEFLECIRQCYHRYMKEMNHSHRGRWRVRERFAAPVLSLIFMALLLAYMQLHHDLERVDPDTVLLTNHWTGEVRRCHRSRNSELSCLPKTLEPRSWYLALSPFDSPAERVAKQGDKSNLLAEFIFCGGFALAIVMLFAFPIWDWRKDRDRSSTGANGGSMSHGDAGPGGDGGGNS